MKPCHRVNTSGMRYYIKCKYLDVVQSRVKLQT